MFFSSPKLESCPTAQPSSTSKPRGNQRKRLQKKQPPQAKYKTSIYSCKGATDLDRLQTCLNLLSGVHKEDSIKMQSQTSMYSREDEVYFQSLAELDSDRPIKIQIPNEIEELEVQRWRNTKTPVFAIGQLEMRTSQHPNRPTAEGLASIYQTILPSPPITPCPGSMRAIIKPERIRRIKNQRSLRQHIDDQSSPDWTETETLCSYEPERNEDSRLSNVTCPAPNPGLDLCSGLLTCELAAVFFQQHPQEHQNRASRLQIQLMIEGYEETLQKLRREPDILQKMGMDGEDLMTTEKILYHWLDVLYYLYDLADGLNPANI